MKQDQKTPTLEPLYPLTIGYILLLLIQYELWSVEASPWASMRFSVNADSASLLYASDGLWFVFLVSLLSIVELYTVAKEKVKNWPIPFLSIFTLLSFESKFALFEFSYLKALVGVLCVFSILKASALYRNNAFRVLLRLVSIVFLAAASWQAYPSNLPEGLYSAVSCLILAFVWGRGLSGRSISYFVLSICTLVLFFIASTMVKVASQPLVVKTTSAIGTDYLDDFGAESIPSKGLWQVAWQKIWFDRSRPTTERRRDIESTFEWLCYRQNRRVPKRLKVTFLEVFRENLSGSLEDPPGKNSKESRPRYRCGT